MAWRRDDDGDDTGIGAGGVSRAWEWGFLALSDAVDIEGGLGLRELRLSLTFYLLSLFVCSWFEVYFRQAFSIHRIYTAS